LDAAVFVYEVKEVAESVEIVVEPIASFHLETEPKEGSTMTAAWHPVFQVGVVTPRAVLNLSQPGVDVLQGANSSAERS
jgi:hypothetical protein